MDPTTALGSAFAAFGLSGAAGLNAWIPLLVTGLVHRVGWMDLPDPYDALGTTPALLALGLALVVDFVGDKVAAVDHVLHAAGVVVQPAAGAILFAAQTGVGGDLDPGVALVAGAIISGSVHAGRASLRPASTATTGGTANPVLSVVEDVIAFALTAVAFLLPILAFVLVVGLLLAVVLSIRLLWRRLRRGRSRSLAT